MGRQRTTEDGNPLAVITLSVPISEYRRILHTHAERRDAVATARDLDEEVSNTGLGRCGVVLCP